MKWSYEGKWISGGFGLTLLFMALVNVTSYKNVAELNESNDRVQNTYEILNNLSNFYSNMTIAESGRRGYIVSGSQQELERHQIAVSVMKFEIEQLQRQINDPIQDQHLDRLKSLTYQRLALFARSIFVYQQRKSAFQEQVKITEKSVKIREQINTVIEDLKQQEEQLLQVWLKDYRSGIEGRVTINLFTVIFNFLIISIIYLMIYRQGKQRQKLADLEYSLAQQKELGELKVKLFSMISHEFRTPLSVILASSQLLAEILDGLIDESKLKNLDRIQSSTKLMNQLLTDILTLTRAEVGELKYYPESLNLESFCLNLVEDLQFINSKKYLLRFTNQGEYFRANVDEKILYSMLNNLLLNAIKYSPAGGSIDLILDNDRDIIIFQVKDEGIGISIDDQTKIYELFYRGSNVENIVGSGLGLAVVKKCVELHHGTIEVESEIGKGTKFTVKIPRQ